MLHGAEQYDHLREGFAPVLDEINDMIREAKITIDGRTFELKFMLDGDFKVNATYLYANNKKSILNCSFCCS